MRRRPNHDFGPPARTKAPCRHEFRYGSERDIILHGVHTYLDV
jgi:hypothetical protein